MKKLDEESYYELSGMRYVGFQYTHDSLLPAHKVLKNLAKIIKEAGLTNTIIQSINTTSSPYNEDEFLTTIIVSL